MCATHAKTHSIANTVFESHNMIFHNLIGIFFCVCLKSASLTLLSIVIYRIRFELCLVLMCTSESQSMRVGWYVRRALKIRLYELCGGQVVLMH